MTYEALEAFAALFKVGGSGSPTSSDYAGHLSGKSEVSHSDEPARFVRAMIARGSVPCDAPCVTIMDGGQAWLYLFLDRVCDYDSARLERVARYYDCELDFSGRHPLPFFDCDNAGCEVVNPGGERFALVEEALQHLSSRRVSDRDLDKWEQSLPYGDAPFCVQSFFLSKGCLPWFADTYLDSKGLPIEGHLGKDFEKATYPMDCAGMPWKCDRDECRRRKYGCESPEMTELSFGELTQFRGATVFYRWMVNGRELRLDSELDIIRQERFMPACVRQIGVLPRRLSNPYWMRIVNKALSKMRTVGSGGECELTTERLKRILTDDLRGRTVVSNRFDFERVMQGWVFIDPSTAHMTFQPDALCAYVRGRYPDLVIDSANDFKRVLIHLGFRGRRVDVDEVRKRFWYARSEYLFDDREDWKEYMLEVSKGTIWEGNFRAFLLEDGEPAPPLAEEDEEAAAEMAAVYLDTEESK